MPKDVRCSAFCSAMVCRSCFVLCFVRRSWMFCLVFCLALGGCSMCFVVREEFRPGDTVPRVGQEGGWVGFDLFRIVSDRFRIFSDRFGWLLHRFRSFSDRFQTTHWLEQKFKFQLARAGARTGPTRAEPPTPSSGQLTFDLFLKHRN